MVNPVTVTIHARCLIRNASFEKELGVGVLTFIREIMH